MASDTSDENSVSTSVSRGNTALSTHTNCILHIGDGAEKDSEPFTKVRWKKFQECARQWLETSDNHEVDIANTWVDYLDTSFADIPNNCGFHPACYRRFIDKKRITGALRRCQKASSSKRTVSDVDEPAPSPKRLRSKVGLLGQVGTPHRHRSRHVLPKICIICRKTDRFITVHKKRENDRLIQAETKDAGRPIRDFIYLRTVK